MLTVVARMALFFKLRRQMHPGMAYLVTLACYPRRLRPATIIPIVTPPDALSHTERWQITPTTSPEGLLETLYGREQRGLIDVFLERGEDGLG